MKEPIREIRPPGPARRGRPAPRGAAPRSEAGTPGHDANPLFSSRELTQLWKEMRQDLGSLGRDAQILARLRWQRVRLALREGALGLAFGIWIVLVALVASIVAAVLLVLGLAHGVSSLADQTAWVGQLIVGGLIVGAGIGGFLLARKRIERRFAQEIRRRFGPAPEGPPVAPSPSSTHATDDGPTGEPS